MVIPLRDDNPTGTKPVLTIVIIAACIYIFAAVQPKGGAVNEVEFLVEHAAIPCEVFVEIGLELKSKSPAKPLFTVSLANGYNGYLPTPDQHKLGGYETWRARSSYLEPDASPKIVAKLLELLGGTPALP